MSIFPKKYDPSIEEQINKMWIENNLFAPDNQGKKQDTEKFVISMPPPNVTWILHLGHAFMLSIEDAFVRHARMRWKETLRIPWTDHAWIATQAVVEKKLKEEWISRYDLWREKFVDKVWDWAKYSRSTIINQTKQMWASCDWNREEFTMSERLSRAVRKAFVNLYQSWKIYQWDYIVNWCPESQTVISDIEVNYEEEETNLYHIRYFIEWKWDSITIATVRPETIFADVAIAVHPKDKRYKKFIWKNVLIPIVNRPIPVIADEYVDTTFGSWALKITPTHDPNDFNIWKNHDLPLDRFAIDKDWCFTSWAGEFEWHKAKDVMGNLTQMLDEIWNLEKIEKYTTKVPYSERYNTRIQPMLSKQWFVDTKDSAQASIDLVNDWEVNICPERFNKNFFNWLNDIKPWCISRQLWWWHRIPVWYCENWHKNVYDEDSVISSIKQNEKTSKYTILSMIIFNLISDLKLKKHFNIEELINVLFDDSILPHQWKIYRTYIDIYKTKYKNDSKLLNEVEELEDVLDFMSSKENDILSKWDKLVDILWESYWIQEKWDFYEFIFYCQSCDSQKLKQDEDVLDTWFSSSLWPFSILWWPEKTTDFERYYPNQVMWTWYDILFFRVARMVMMWWENLGQKPFDNVYLHWLVKDKNWEKFSKSKWNNIDPAEVIKTYWADSMRLSLVLWTTPGNDTKFSMEKVEYNKRFINKLWNATRFIHVNYIWDNASTIDYDLIREDINKNFEHLNDFDKWIVNQINELVVLWEKSFKNFMLWEFWQNIVKVAWHDFCDWYIEISKISSSEYTQKVLLYWIWTILKLLHPYAPFVTEKLWSLLWFEWFLIVSDYPQTIEVWEKNSKINLLMDLISEWRNLRHQSELKPHEKVDICVQSNSRFLEFLKQYENIFTSLIWVNNISYLSENEQIPEEYHVGVVFDVKLGLKWIKQISVAEQIENLEKQKSQEEQFLQSLRSVVTSPWFMEKAPEKVVEEKTQKIEEVKNRILDIQYEIDKLKMKK